jgi:hypothetical protein
MPTIPKIRTVHSEHEKQRKREDKELDKQLTAFFSQIFGRKLATLQAIPDEAWDVAMDASPPGEEGGTE